MRNTGIFGGTFNPIHLGHVRLGQMVLNDLKLDRIIYIPDNTPPHKSDKDLASGSDRLKMIELALKDCGNMEASDIELRREGKSYTYQTLLELKKMYPGDELFLITGADMFLTLDRWKEPGIIFENAGIIGVPRVGSDYDRMEKYASDVIIPMGARVFMLSHTVFDAASSTFVRDNIDDYHKIADMISPEVYGYITENNLYRK